MQIMQLFNINAFVDVPKKVFLNNLIEKSQGEEISNF